MKILLVTPKSSRVFYGGYRGNEYDQPHGYVVVAKDVENAKTLVVDNNGNDNWSNEELVDYEIIGTGKGPERIVLEDFLSG